MRRPGRRTAVVGGGVVLAVALAMTAAFVLLVRGESAEDVSEQYLVAIWEGDWRTECDLASQQWRRVLFDGHPFADCTEFAVAAGQASRDGGFEEFRGDTDIDITVLELSSEDGKARVAYVIEFDYHGNDRAGFDALWQGGGTTDRGTVELVDIDGHWRIAGVDAG